MSIRSCRCCLGSKALRSLFVASKRKGSESLTYSKMIAACCTLPISPNDGLPEHICSKCLPQLKVAYKFRLKCIQTHESLRKISCIDDSKEFLQSIDPIECCFNDESKPLKYGSTAFDNVDIQEKDIKLEFENQNILTDSNDLDHDINSDIDSCVNDVSKSSFAECPENDSAANSGSEGDITSLLKKIKLNRKLKIKSPLKCPKCNIELDSKRDYTNHLKSHDLDIKTERYFCDICQKSYASERKHKYLHTEKYMNPDPHECEICKRVFLKRANYMNHLKIHSDDKSFVCGECGASFKQPAGLTQHRLIHKEKKYSCEYCSKKFTLKYSCIVHMRSHTQEKPYKCSFCPKQFATGNKRNIHLATHIDLISETTDNNNLEDIKKSILKRKSRIDLTCAYCTKVFQRKSKLEEHINVHLGIKNYFCEICQKFYTSKRGHEVLHSKKSECQCSICDRKFAYKLLLKDHMRTHSDERAFRCHCGASFKQPSGLYQHKLTHKEKAYVCQYCSSRFALKHTLIIHLRTHTKERPYECDKCPKKFTASSHLKIHILRHGDARTLCCEFCEKRFKTNGDLKKHIKVHEKERKYPCKVCDRTFFRSDHRNRHEATVHSLQESKMEDCGLT